MRIDACGSLSQSHSECIVALMSNGFTPLSYHPDLVEINEVVVKVKEMTGTHMNMTYMSKTFSVMIRRWLMSC